MKIPGKFLFGIFAAALTAAPASAVVRSIPVVTQVQGLTFYRTSVTLSNADPILSTEMILRFSYRSPDDGTFQVVDLTIPALGPRRVRFFDDIIQALKDSGQIRLADMDEALFGTLLVNFVDIDEADKTVTGAVARTYSPAEGGGTLGIAYAGRCFCLTGSQGRVLGAGRSGVFGNDGSTRANLGIVNEGFGPTDVRVRYYNGDTGALLRDFLVSQAAGHALQENEVFQMNNIFANSAIPSAVHSMVVEVQAVTAGVYVSAYVVQLDNTSNDGSFFFLEEE